MQDLTPYLFAIMGISAVVIIGFMIILKKKK